MLSLTQNIIIICIGKILSFQMSSPLLIFFTNSSLHIFSYRVNFPVLSSIIHLLLAQIMRMNAKKCDFLMLDGLQSGFRVSSHLLPKQLGKSQQTELLVALQHLEFCVFIYSHAFCISSSQNECH